MHDGPIAHVVLNRAEKRNALDQAMLEAIAETIEQLANAGGTRAVVLSGDGAAFCAGLDFMSFAAMLQNPESVDFIARSHGDANLFQHVSTGWRDLPMPVITALHGVAFGGGFQIMLGADIRVAAPHTKFSIMEAKWGLVPDMGGMALMPALARQDIVRRLSYTAEIFDAAQALEWGFVTEVTEDPLARAMELAAQISARSPDGTQVSKRLISNTWGANRKDTLMAESEAQKSVLGGENQMEAVMANFEKRPPIFKD
ncbi:enoyl-CoA hydratase [Rhodobacterales bacterium 52_120_T64]|nr:enoyl-CoA hydratase [Rhodobacterales bacterium 52_120_T64]